MDPRDLEKLGLAIRPSGDTWEADLEITASLVNPLTQKFIARATLTQVGERLMVLSPPELVGLPPLNAQGVTRGSELEEQLARNLDEYIFMLQRRSEELQALGIAPNIQPETLLL